MYMIKHLILSGGSWKGFYMLGVIQELIKKKYIEIDKIQSVWGTSVGSLIAVFLCLKLDWECIVEFCINKPFKMNEIDSTFDNILEIYNTCGIFDIDLFYNITNLFNAQKIDLKNITLKEFYDFSKKDLHIFAVNYDTLETVDFNHETHPDIKLIEAIYCSCSIPLIFKPLKINNVIYLDGGINEHFPTEKCCKKKNKKEILGIYIKTIGGDKKDSELNIINFSMDLLYKIVFEKQKKHLNNLKNQLIITTPYFNFEMVKDILLNKEKRNEIVEGGKNYAYIFLNTKKN